MSETPDELRARLNALIAAATPLPWDHRPHEFEHEDAFVSYAAGIHVQVLSDASDDGQGGEGDAALIAALVNAWPTIDALLARLATAEARLESLICGMVSLSGPNGEPLACGFRHGHDGEHSWATLPTFVARREQP